MAGTTLRGIGEDESDEETPPPEKEQPSGPTVVDNAKVAESLRKLRSLEDRSGSINAGAHNPRPKEAAAAAPAASPPASDATGGAVGEVVDNEATVPMTPADLPGVAQGMMKPPAAAPDPSANIKTPAPLPATSVSGTLTGHPTQTLLGMSVASLLGQPPAAGTLHGAPTNTLLGQSVGTLLGHHPVAENTARPPIGEAGPEPARPNKTLFGHSVPLPEQLTREQAHRDPNRITSSGRRTPAIGGDGVPSPEFSGGDHHFFESEPINDLYEPEFPRPKLFAKVAVGVAAASIVTVAVLAYVRFSGPADTEEGAAPATATQSSPAPAPSPSPPPTPTPSVEPTVPPPPTTAAAPTEPAPTATAPAPAPSAGQPTGVGPPASDDPALKTPPATATAAAPPAPTASSPLPSAPQAEPKSEPKDDKKSVASRESSKEPSEQPKLEKPAEPSTTAEKKPAIAKAEVTKEAAKTPKETARSPVAKLTAKEPVKETPGKPAKEPVAAREKDSAKSKDPAVKPIVVAPKPVTPKPVAVGAGSKPGVSGYQARTDSTKSAPSAAKPAKPVTSLSARDGAARPMKLTSPAAPGVRPAAAPKPGGRAKVEDDPDATMPLSE